MDWQMQSYLPQILYYAGILRCMDAPFYLKEHSFLMEMKTYAISAPHYAWKVLEGFQKNKRDRNRQNIKSHKKNLFLEEILHQTIMDSFIERLTRSLEEKEKRQPIELTTREQDDRLRDRYLKQVFGFRMNNLQVNYIDLDPKIFKAKDQSCLPIGLKNGAQVQVFVEHFDA